MEREIWVHFSIVIIARKINDYIREAMPHLQAQTCRSYEILIVSESPETETFENARILTSGRASPARARNIGAREARGEILVFIDDDAYPAPDWLEKALRDFQDETVGAVGGPSLVPPGATFFQHVSNKVFELSSTRTGRRYSRRKDKVEIDVWPTCNFFVREKVFEAVGGFSDKYWGGEDTTFCYDLIKAGFRMLYDPDLLVYHHPRKTLKQHLRQIYFWGVWRSFMMKRDDQSVQGLFFAPSLLLVWLLGGAVLSALWLSFRPLYGASWLLYGAYLAVAGFRTKSLRLALPVAVVTLFSHLVYGFGFLRGLVSWEDPTRKTLNPSAPVSQAGRVSPTPRAGA
ncbi:MAG: glycosyltransferase [Verrucomicrobia bacterium]|nr:glycosyltransferase [Verrucomicrobiota bacterium]